MIDGGRERGERNAHFVVYEILSGVLICFVRYCDIEIAIIPCIRRAGDVTMDILAFGDGYCGWSVEDGLSSDNQKRDRGIGR